MPTFVIIVIAVYFSVVFAVSLLTTRGGSAAGERAFFVGEGRSPWYVVAVAMVGTSITGVTYVSVPGMVAASQFAYMQMVIGFVAGYAIVAFALLPLYYRLRLCSIYGYLGQRFGAGAYRTGAAVFLVSKFLSCAVKMYLTAVVLQLLLFDAFSIPYYINVSLIMLAVWLNTFRGGVRTLVWTDLFQTLCLLTAMLLFVLFICDAMGLTAAGFTEQIWRSPMSRTWFLDDANDKRFFWKQFLAGMFTTVAMTGLDQDMMQKNLSCRSLREAQKNMLCYGTAFIPVNLVFLFLGVLLYDYARQLGMYDGAALTSLQGRPLAADELFPYLATAINPATGSTLLPAAVGIIFVMGLIAAAFSSAGSAVTALTTTVTVDLLQADKGGDRSLRRIRLVVHLAVTLLMGAALCLLRSVADGSVINTIYVVVSYTYGPLLGLFFVGLYTRLRPRGKAVPFVCLLSPMLCYILSENSVRWFGGYQMGYELLLVNGALTALGLAAASVGRRRR